MYPKPKTTTLCDLVETLKKILSYWISFDIWATIINHKRFFKNLKLVVKSAVGTI